MSSIASEYLRNENIASQPWPQDTVLYQPYEEEQILLPEHASCLAVRTYLTMLKLPFTVEQRANAEFMSPGGKRTKLPVLRSENFIQAEFEHIVNFVEMKGYSLSQDLPTKDDMRSYLCLVENIFTNAEQYICWVDADVLQKVTRQRNGCVYPFPLNHVQNWRKERAIRRQLSIANASNNSLTDVVDQVDKLCQALSSQLGDSLYFYGDKPTELDALVFGHLFSIFTMKLPNNVLAMTINRHSNLNQFCMNIEKKFFPVMDKQSKKKH